MPIGRRITLWRRKATFIPSNPKDVSNGKGDTTSSTSLFIGGVGLWGHPSSTDLLHRRHYPIVFDITPDDPEECVYAGVALTNKEGVPL